MAGLLGQNTSRGLLGGSLSRMNVGATDEAMRRMREMEAARMAQERAARPQGGLLGGNSPAQAAPQRERVSGWRVLDRVLGGQTVTGGLDAERARLSAEAMRPQMEARQAQLRALAESMGPAALIAFDTNPEKFGESLAEQYSPQVIAAGGVQSVIGSGNRVSAPRDMEFGDSLVRTDPLQPAPQTLMQRGPTFGEETARLNANNPINVAPGGRAVDPRTGAVIAEGAPRVFSAADATQLYTEDGGLMAENRRDAPPVDPRAAQQAAGTANAALERIRNTRAKVNEALGDANGMTAGFIGGLTSRIGGTPAANLAATIDTIEANLSFGELQKMRDNSPTGGALGQITERELALLGATVASLRQSQSPEQLRRNLGVINESLARWEAAVRQGQQAAPTPSAPAARSSGPIAQDAQGNRVQWNGSAWVPLG